jgi:hypothetical protein
VIVPESKQIELGQHHRHPSAFYSSYRYDSEKYQVPEVRDYWYYYLTELLLSEVHFYVESLQADFSNLGP